MDRLPIMLIDSQAGEKHMFFTERVGDEKALSITLEGKKHTFFFKMAAIMYVVVFGDAGQHEVVEITDPQEAACIAKWKFSNDLLSHTLYRTSEAAARKHVRAPSRFKSKAISV